MAKKFKTGAAPVSKYAAKKAKLAKSNDSVVDNEVITDSTEDTQEFSFKKKTKGYNIPDFAKKIPDHIIQIYLLLHNNAEIRRFTALGILNYLLQTKQISGEKRFVVFKFNKFSVKCNGLAREYNYTEPFFLNALVASFTSFSASAQITINNFCKNEMSTNIDRCVEQSEVDNIVTLNEEYQKNNSVDVEE